MRQAKHWQMKRAPDVLVIPSRMNPLMRDIEGTSSYMFVMHLKRAHYKKIDTYVPTHTLTYLCKQE